MWLRISLAVVAAVVVSSVIGPASAAETRLDELETLKNRIVSAEPTPEANRLAESARAILARDGALDAPRSWLALALCRYYQRSARFHDALEFGQTALQGFKRLSPTERGVALALNSLGFLNKETASFAESRHYYDEALRLLSEMTDVEHRRLYIQVLNNRGKLAFVTGKYAEAEHYYQAALAICDDLYLAVQPQERKYVTQSKGQTLNNFATLNFQQKRYDRAAQFYAEASELFRGATDEISRIGAADVLENVGTLHRVKQEFDAAGAKYAEALELRLGTSGEEHHHTARTKFQLAKLRAVQGRVEEASKLFDEVYRVRLKILGEKHPDTAAVLVEKASLARRLGKLDEAEEMLGTAIARQEEVGAGYGERYRSLVVRAQLHWTRSDKARALDDIGRAMDCAEKQREDYCGADREMATDFAEFRTAFELAMLWQADEPEKVFSVMERSRSRSLLDRLASNGFEVESEWERNAAPDVKVELSTLRSKLAELRVSLAKSTKTKFDELQSERLVLEGKLAVLIERNREGGPIWRDTVRDRLDHTRLSDLQRELKAADKLLMMYTVTEDDTLLLVIDGRRCDLHRLQVDDESAESLAIRPGKLRRSDIARCLRNSDGRITRSLQTPQPGANDYKILHACYRVVIPTGVTELLADHAYRGLTVVPDGALGAIPFEALVMRHTETDARFFIDESPPIEYAPSIGVWRRLGERRVAQKSPSVGGIVTLGNPTYPAIDGRPPIMHLGIRGTPRGQSLPQLPYSGNEAESVFTAFSRGEREMVTKLIGKEATEGRLRSVIENKRVIHLACHGFVDDASGNFFGHLALAPGRTPPTIDDDGQFTLDEICRLKLSGCEVAVLSACHTNSMPEQFGEGTWGLSHGFVVAGATRVVASNWLVDDEAAAQLVVDYLSRVATAGDSKIRHAEALRDAKRNLTRNNPKWSAPYYWAPFVLLAAD